MITRLYLDNCFRHFGRTFFFEKGLTGVVGPNESGKSLIVEMIRYALFGSAALRGKSEDYKKLHVELDFKVGEQAYTVIRKAGQHTLFGDRQVTGTKPVNEAIRAILGYDLTVFDVANACNQGNIEALSDMTPSARKAMVDRTIGLNQLDKLIQHCGTEGNALKREAEATKSALQNPTPPVEPEDYVSSWVLEQWLKQATPELKEFLELQAFLDQSPEAPQAPEPCKVTESSADLQTYQAERAKVQGERERLTQQVRGIEPEEYTREDINTFKDWLTQADAWRRKQDLLAQGHICCPECKHEWPVADLGDLADVKETKPPSMTWAQLREHEQRIGNKKRIEELQLEIEALVVPKDRAEDLNTRQKWEAETEGYERQKAVFDRYNAAVPEKASRHLILRGIEERVERLRRDLNISHRYEDARRVYEDAKAAFDKLQAQVAEKEKRSAEFLEARKIIQDLKVNVKSHLLPSLNQVASSLISQMTGGERYMVEVDDDFEICIDGQPLATLSGSGKAVANLAIRIALGQVLTNRVFSVFMADEVDAAMDDERAQHTAQALQRLTGLVGQVLLVTHKHPETDHTFELRKS